MLLSVPVFYYICYLYYLYCTPGLVHLLHVHLCIFCIYSFVFIACTSFPLLYTFLLFCCWFIHISFLYFVPSFGLLWLASCGRPDRPCCRSPWPYMPALPCCGACCCPCSVGGRGRGRWCWAVGVGYMVTTMTLTEGAWWYLYVCQSNDHWRTLTSFSMLSVLSIFYSILFYLLSWPYIFSFLLCLLPYIFAYIFVHLLLRYFFSTSRTWFCWMVFSAAAFACRCTVFGTCCLVFWSVAVLVQFFFLFWCAPFEHVHFCTRSFKVFSFSFAGFYLFLFYLSTFYYFSCTICTPGAVHAGARHLLLLFYLPFAVHLFAVLLYICCTPVWCTFLYMVVFRSPFGTVQGAVGARYVHFSSFWSIPTYIPVVIIFGTVFVHLLLYTFFSFLLLYFCSYIVGQPYIVLWYMWRLPSAYNDQLMLSFMYSPDIQNHAFVIVRESVDY